MLFSSEEVSIRVQNQLKNNTLVLFISKLFSRRNHLHKLSTNTSFHQFYFLQRKPKENPAWWKQSTTPVMFPSLDKVLTIKRVPLFLRNFTSLLWLEFTLPIRFSSIPTSFSSSQCRSSRCRKNQQTQRSLTPREFLKTHNWRFQLYLPYHPWNHKLWS